MPDRQESFFEEAHRNQRSPLANRLRPRSLDDIVGQQHLVGENSPLRNMIVNDHLVSMILWGPAGTGKTSLAEVIAQHTNLNFERLSAVSSGVADMRKIIQSSEQNILSGQPVTVMFLDEVHALSKNQQDVLLPAVETGSVILIGATTENPYSEINGPLLSRCQLFRLESLSVVDIRKVISRGLKMLSAHIQDDAAEELVQRSSGDARQALSLLEMVFSTKQDRTSVITLQDVLGSGAVKIYETNKETYYDEVAAWIQSMNGSNPQAAVYWLARLLAAGVDVKFLARRIMVLASEDVGLADPQAMVVAAACIQAVQFVGLPECALNLSEATLYMAQAPKSNRSAVAVWQAQKYVGEHANYSVPPVMQSRENWWHDQTGAGKGYRYPHAEGGYSAGQQYLPDEVRSARFYEPADVGFEREIAERMGEREELDQAARRKGKSKREGPARESSKKPEVEPVVEPATEVGTAEVPDSLPERQKVLLTRMLLAVPDEGAARKIVAEVLSCDTDLVISALKWAQSGDYPDEPKVEGYSPRDLADRGYSVEKIFPLLQQIRLEPQEANQLFKPD